MKTTLTNFIQKRRYYLYVICIIINIPGAILLNHMSFFALGWCIGLLFCAMVNDDII